MLAVVAMSSSQCVNRGRACTVVNRDNYSEYYMCVSVQLAPTKKIHFTLAKTSFTP